MRSAVLVALAVACSCSGKGGSPSSGPDSGTSGAAPSSIAQNVAAPPLLLASDGTALFWIDQTGALWSVPVGGGTPTQIATGASGAIYLSVDSTNAYFIGSGGFSSVPKQGGTPAVMIATPNEIWAATVAGGTAYWAEQEPEVVGSPPSLPPPEPPEVVKSAPFVAGGAATTLGTLPGIPSAIAVAGSVIFLAAAGTPLQTLPIAGGSPTASSVSGCLRLLAGADGVYCGGSQLTLVASDGTETPIAAATNNVTSIAVDSTNVYWVNSTASGSVVAAPTNGGGSATTIASDAYPLAVAVDDAGVYWSDNAGNIQRAAKP
ncbi:MAG: hypothetical protein ACLQVI_09200 [Polyangiaceae bacterium]